MQLIVKIIYTIKIWWSAIFDSILPASICTSIQYMICIYVSMYVYLYCT